MIATEVDGVVCFDESFGNFVWGLQSVPTFLKNPRLGESGEFPPCRRDMSERVC